MEEWIGKVVEIEAIGGFDSKTYTGTIIFVDSDWIIIYNIKKEKLAIRIATIFNIKFINLRSCKKLKIKLKKIKKNKNFLG